MINGEQFTIVFNAAFVICINLYLIIRISNHIHVLADLDNHTCEPIHSLQILFQQQLAMPGASCGNLRTEAVHYKHLAKEPLVLSWA